MDRDDFTQQEIAELDERLEALPERLKISKAKRPNLAETFLSLREDKNFIRHLKEAVKKRLRSKCQNEGIPPAIKDDDLEQKVSPHSESSTDVSCVELAWRLR